MENIKNKFQSLAKKPISAFLCIIAINLVIWAFALFFGVHWDSCDDPMIAQLLQNNNYYYLYVGKGVSWFVHQLFRLSATVEWWTLFHIALCSIGISLCVYSVIHKYPNKHGFVFGGGLLLTGWFMSVYLINFTRTATVISVGGVSLILLALSEGTGRKSVLKYVLGTLLILLGIQVRWEAGFLALGFLALGGFIYLVRQPELFKKTWWLKNRKVIVMLLITAVVAVGMTCLESITKTEKEKAIASFDNTRSSVQDFTGHFSGLLNNDEKCKSIGLSSSNDITMLINWMNDDPEVFTKEQLTKISEAKDKTDFIKTSLSATKQTVKIFVMSQLGVLLIIVVVIALFTNFKKNIFPVLLTLLFAAALLLFLCFQGRMGARVYDSVMFAAIFIVLFHSDFSKHHISPKCIAEILLAVLFVTSVWLKTPETQRVTPFNEREIQSKLNYGNYDLINENRENIYFCLPFMNNALTKASVWTIPPEDYCDNFIPLGGWTSYASNTIDNKEKCGIDNPFRDLLEKENAYLVYSKEKQLYLDECEQVLRFLREHYDPSTVMVELGNIGTFSVVQYRSGN